MKFFYKRELLYLYQSGLVSRAFVQAIQDIAVDADAERLYLTDQNYARATASIDGYSQDRWDNYYSNIAITAENTPIVIPYYADPLDHRTEEQLRYCLRSIDTNLAGTHQIILVGNAPDWITNITFIPMSRFPAHPRQKSIDSIRKQIAGAEQILSGEFIIQFADTYYIQPTPVDLLRSPTALQQWTYADLQAWTPQNNWEFTRRKSMMAYCLANRVATATDYSTHMPYLYDKTKFLAMCAKYKLDQCHLLENNEGVYCPEVLYFNEYPPATTPKPAIDQRVILDDQNQRTSAYVMTHNPAQFSRAISFLDSLFPSKGRYET